MEHSEKLNILLKELLSSSLKKEAKEVLNYLPTREKALNAYFNDINFNEDDVYLELGSKETYHGNPEILTFEFSI